MIKISVIIPCYNAEQHICECIESVQKQTLHDIEIIGIDDGSTDRTLAILEDYSGKSNNIRIIHQRNQGVGVARNQGIKIATGEYLAFMDADDFYPFEDALETLYNTAKQQDAEICGGSLCVYRNGVYAHNGLWKDYSFAQDGWIKKEDFPIYAGFTKFIYKKQLIDDNDIYFPEYSWFEDPPFFLTAISHVECLYCMKKVTYVYRKAHKLIPFTQKMAVDCVRGMWDCWNISVQAGLSKICDEILNNIHGDISAMMYLYEENSDEIKYFIHQFNVALMERTGSETQVALLKEGNELAEYMEAVKKEMCQLLEVLRKEKRVLIFGAGRVARVVLSFMKEYGIAIEAIVVSDVWQNADALDGLPIKCIDEYAEEKDAVIILIATLPKLHEEILSMLRQKEFDRLHALSVEKFYLFRGEVFL